MNLLVDLFTDEDKELFEMSRHIQFSIYVKFVNTREVVDWIRFLDGVWKTCYVMGLFMTIWYNAWHYVALIILVFSPMWRQWTPLKTGLEKVCAEYEALHGRIRQEITFTCLGLGPSRSSIERIIFSLAELEARKRLLMGV